MMRTALFLSVCLAAPAFANGMVAGDLGLISSREDCKSLADEALRIYAEELGEEPSIASGHWIVSAYSIGPGKVDVSLLCPDYREDDQEVLNGYILVHETFDARGGAEDPQARMDTIHRLIEIFKGLKTEL